MRGEVVIVRAHGGQALVRRVWEVKGNVVYITNDEQLKRHESGLPMLWPVGFTSDDVFCFSPEIANRGNVEWKRLKPYEG
jgi:hypothetical protein